MREIQNPRVFGIHLQKGFLSLVALLFCCIQLYAQNYQGKQKDIDHILKNAALFSKYYVAGDMQSLVNCYTGDGKIFPGNSDIIEGKAGLTDFWKIPEGTTILSHKITPVEIKVMKKTAYDYGYYEGETQPAGGEKSYFKGKYVIVWKKVDKDWKIYIDIWNRIAQ